MGSLVMSGYLHASVYGEVCVCVFSRRIFLFYSLSFRLILTRSERVTSAILFWKIYRGQFNCVNIFPLT